MLTPELESRMSKIIEKLDKLEIKVQKDKKEDFLSEYEKYEYLVQKNAQKRVSQNFEKISDFFDSDKKEEKETTENDSQENEYSIALNMKKKITIGEFQIELEKLLELLEDSLNKEDNKGENYLNKYVKDISLITDEDNPNLMDDATKIKKFSQTLVKKYHKISHLLKRYIRENGIVSDLLLKEKQKGGVKKNVRGKRRSLFDNAPLISEKRYKAIKGFPNLGNTFMKEMLENMEKKKRSSCVNIGNVGKKEEPLSCDKSSDEEEEEEEIEENDEKIPAYRPGKLRSSFMFN